MPPPTPMPTPTPPPTPPLTPMPPSPRPPAPLRVLLVEDNPADARLVWEMLAEAAPPDGDPWAVFCLDAVARLADALPRLAAGLVDVVLLDLSLPDDQGLEVVRRVRAAAPDVPIVVMSGNDDETLALAGVRDGAQDYLVKGRVEGALLVRALRYAWERQQAADRLRATTRALEAKTREQEATIYTMSHDLKAPLVSLHGMAELLVEDYGARLEPAARQYLDRIAANARKMRALIDELLELSRVGRDPGAPTSVDLGAVVAAVTDQLGHSLAARGAEVRVEGSLPRVLANPTRLGQVFTNLIDNAVAYTSPDRAPRVVITARAQGDCWEIRVRDNGVGIPAAFHDKIFQVFQRLPDGKRLNPGGSGAGLAIVVRIIETHGGRIWLESAEGRGTTVFFTLPIQQGDKARPPLCRSERGAACALMIR